MIVFFRLDYIRPNQIKYSKLVEEVLTGHEKIGIIEAGTGLGKSMAYLFGAYKSSYDLEGSGPTVIACHTKPLQDQLFFKDLPQLFINMLYPLLAYFQNRLLFSMCVN